MATLNKVTLIGYLGHDPEMGRTSHGDTVAQIALATTEVWKDKSTGERKESTEWHRIVLYRKLAETAGQYLKKGSLVYIEGRLQTRKWTGQDGIERYSTGIIGEDMRMLGRSQSSDAAAASKEPATVTRQDRYNEVEEDAIPF